MTKKGFTLLEIIISITLISVIGIGTSVILINNKYKDLYEIENKIAEAANMFLSLETDNNGKSYEEGIYNGGKGVYLKVGTLVDNGYLSKEILNTLEEKTGYKEKDLKLLAAYSIHKNNDSECGNGFLEYKFNWNTNHSDPIYLCPYDSTATKDDDIPDGFQGELVNKLFKKYKYTTEIPDFSIKAPNSNDSFSYVVRNNIVKKKVDIRVDDEIYFSNKFEFDGTTGKFKLIDPSLNKVDKAYNNSQYYMCSTRNETECTIIYKIISFKQYRYVLDMTVDTYTSIESPGKGNSGLYRYFDEDGYTYYFRGNIDNNYVQFKDSNIKFQIVRFNGDNSIRLVTVDPITENNTTKYINYDGKYVYEATTVNYEVSETVSEKDMTKINKGFKNSTDYYGYTICNSIVIDGKSLSYEDCNYVSTTELKNNTSNYIGKFVSKWTRSDGSTYGGIFSSSGYYQITNYDASTYTIYGKKVSKVTNDSIVDSELKSSLNIWYENNKTIFDQYTVNGKFCVDRMSTDDYIDIYQERLIYSSDYINNKVMITPTYKCYESDEPLNGGKFISKVGTLTADDLVFGGMIPSEDPSVYSCNGCAIKVGCRSCEVYETKPLINHKSMFLYRNNNFYTLNGFMFVYDGFNPYHSELYDYYTHPGQYLLIENGIIYDKETYEPLNFAIYPVINIKSNVNILSGDGSENNPYILYYKES